MHKRLCSPAILQSLQTSLVSPCNAKTPPHPLQAVARCLNTSPSSQHSTSSQRNLRRSLLAFSALSAGAVAYTLSKHTSNQQPQQQQQQADVDPLISRNLQGGTEAGAADAPRPENAPLQGPWRTEGPWRTDPELQQHLHRRLDGPPHGLWHLIAIG